MPPSDYSYNWLKVIDAPGTYYLVIFGLKGRKSE